MHRPPHPGAILRELYMKPLNVSIVDLWVANQKKPPNVKSLRSHSRGFLTG